MGAAAPNAPSAAAAKAVDKAAHLATHTSVDTGQLLTSNQGLKIADNQNSLRAGRRGPTLLEDQLLREKITAFDHERIPERVVHARTPNGNSACTVVEEADATRCGFDLLDATKLTPEELLPVRAIGKMQLSRNPDNYFAETEQVAFYTCNLVPGIDVSDDLLLQGRMFSYLETQLTRLGGPNFHEIPINRPVCPMHTMNRDGLHRQTIAKGRINYEPSSIDTPPIREVRASQGRVGDKRYPPSPKLSMIARGNPKSAVSRQVALLAADGVDIASLQATKAALVKAGAAVKVLSTRLGALNAASGGTLPVDHMIVTMPSVMFDAVCVFGGPASVAQLKGSGDAVHFVREAFEHAEPMAAVSEGIDFLTATGVLSAGAQAAGVSTGAGVPGVMSSFMEDLGAHRRWDRVTSGAMAA